MSKQLVLFSIITCIVVFASGVRLFKLGEVPHGLSWDEAAVGYNGWSIWTTRRDEWLHFLPVSFKSFGDFKAPLAIYMSGASTMIFGLEKWAIRLPYTLSAIFSIVIFMIIALQLSQKGHFSQQSALYGTAIFAALPWHIHFSRITYESTVALLCLLLAVLCVTSFESIDTRLRARTFTSTLTVSIVLTAFFTALSMYAYHSAKIFVPTFLLCMLVLYRKSLVRNWKSVGIYVVSLVLFASPLLVDSIYGEGGTRSDVLLDFSVSQPMEFLSSVFSNVLLHLDPQYLLLGKTDTLRHSDGAFGILLPGMLFLVIIWIFAVIRYLLLKHTEHSFQFRSREVLFITTSWLFAGMLSGWITKEAPHAHRTLLALPSILILAIFGWEYVAHMMKNTSRLRANIARMVLGLCIVIDILWFIGYQHHYYYVFASASAESFQAGYAEVHSYLDAQRDARTLPGTIVFSRGYGQPYIYALLYGKVPPISYHHGALNNYLFVDFITEGDLARNDALLVATIYDELPIQPTEIIRSQTGAPRFFLYKTSK
jgi:4-amino-4-deoxy-L-arabinose transferase-like glycosyltransferase